tara:strand:- start:934 stop:1224 length:291 start_codon:yes stop_codon:yes gene_type:complete
VNKELARMKFLMEYSTPNGENLLENDLEYYSVKGANSDKSTIGRVKEDEKKDEENDDSSENAEDIVHLPDLEVKYETLKKILKKQGFEISKKSQTD